MSETSQERAESSAPTLKMATLSWLDLGHERARNCPKDGADLAVVGIPDIAYTFEVCRCGSPKFQHLTEQLWHRECLAERGWVVAKAAYKLLLAVRDRKVKHWGVKIHRAFGELAETMGMDRPK